jgi:DNA-binding NtrC family response regulator
MHGRAYIDWVLKQTGGVKKAAAEILGIDPSTLHRKMDKYGLREEKEAESGE